MREYGLRMCVCALMVLHNSTIVFVSVSVCMYGMHVLDICCRTQQL